MVASIKHVFYQLWVSKINWNTPTQKKRYKPHNMLAFNGFFRRLGIFISNNIYIYIYLQYLHMYNLYSVFVCFEYFKYLHIFHNLAVRQQYVYVLPVKFIRIPIILVYSIFPEGINTNCSNKLDSYLIKFVMCVYIVYNYLYIWESFVRA